MDTPQHASTATPAPAARGITRRCLRWSRAHPRTSVLILLLAGLLGLNVLAFMHAWAFTHYAVGGDMPPPPERMSLSEKGKALLLGLSVPKPLNTQTPSDAGLPYETHRYHAAGVDYEAWHIPCEQPRGLCILFHGYANGKSVWLPEAQALHQMGWELFLVDLRGSGGTSGREVTLGYREAEDVAHAVRYAETLTTTGPIILCGRSMGSVAILRAVAECSVQADGLILECPFDTLLSAVQNRFSSMGVPSFPSAQLLTFWGGVQHGYWAFAHKPAEYGRLIRFPVLYMQGARDERVTTQQATRVFDNLAGPKQWVLFADAAHEPYLPKAPDLWHRTVREFLDGARASSATQPASGVSVR